MTDKFSQFLEEQRSLDNETRAALKEAWENKLSEVRAERAEMAANLREEFSKKFTHDKQALVESMGEYIETRIRKEIEDLAEDKKRLSTATVEYKTRIKEHIAKLNSFVVEALAKEVKEFKQDRQEKKEALGKLQEYISEAISKELHEFQEDKKALQEQRVKLVREGKKSLAEAKKNFIKNAVVKVEDAIKGNLKREITQLKEDIKIARENDFGRKIFETFASEYMSSYLSEGSQVNAVAKQLEDAKKKLVDSEAEIATQKRLVSINESKLNAAKDLLTRERKLTKLLAPLNREKKQIMTELLESIKTADLDKAFSKYLPAVLDTNSSTHTSTEKKALKEGVNSKPVTSVATGDRQETNNSTDSSIKEIDDMRRLAGIGKK